MNFYIVPKANCEFPVNLANYLTKRGITVLERHKGEWYCITPCPNMLPLIMTIDVLEKVEEVPNGFWTWIIDNEFLKYQGNLTVVKLNLLGGYFDVHPERMGA